jgi:hypothetical protein
LVAFKVARGVTADEDVGLAGGGVEEGEERPACEGIRRVLSL